MTDDGTWTDLLMPGETQLYAWNISGRSFAIRVATIIAIWAVIGQIASIGQGLGTSLLALPAALVIGLFYMWVFGELDVWPRHRKTDWLLTNRAIHIATGDDLPARLPLEEIRRISRFPPWSLVVRFNTGTTTTLPIPPDPATLRQRIMNARAQLVQAAT